MHLHKKESIRISIGMQSAHAEELDLLGRTHTAKQAEMAVKAAHRAGITKCIYGFNGRNSKQTEQSLKESIAFCHNAGASHISAYLLKIEPNTPYGQQQNTPFCRMMTKWEILSMYGRGIGEQRIPSI